MCVPANRANRANPWSGLRDSTGRQEFLPHSGAFVRCSWLVLRSGVDRRWRRKLTVVALRDDWAALDFDSAQPLRDWDGL